MHDLIDEARKSLWRNEILPVDINATGAAASHKL